MRKFFARHVGNERGDSSSLHLALQMMIVLVIFVLLIAEIVVDTEKMDETDLINSHYGEGAVKEIDRTDNAVFVTLANGDTRKIEIEDGKVRELEVRSLQVTLKQESVASVTESVAEAVVGKQDKASAADMIQAHYEAEKRMVLNIDQRDDNTYLVELASAYVLVFIRNGKVEEVKSEKK